MTVYHRIVLTNARIVTREGIIENGTISILDGKIDYLGEEMQDENFSAEAEENPCKVIDAKGSWVLPGFIDAHVHGGYGSDFMDATGQAFDNITRYHGTHGTTTMLATSVTAPKDQIDQLLYAVQRYKQDEMPYAQLLGAHLEGPFISSKWPGAQNPAYIVPPQKTWIEEWTRQYPEIIRMLTLAPETDGALECIEWLTEHGIIAACGHTDATYEQIQQAVRKGLRHAVHTFNAMKGLHHREPGTVGAVLSDERISGEIIADGHHVHPVCIQLLAKLKTQNNLILITDAIAAAGLGNGAYDLGGLEVIVTDGVARLKNGDSLAGSTLTMIDAFRFVVSRVGLSVPEASRLASGNPAKLLGIDSYTGSLEVGKQADLLLVNEELEIVRVWVKGKELGN